MKYTLKEYPAIHHDTLCHKFQFLSVEFNASILDANLRQWCKDNLDIYGYRYEMYSWQQCVYGDTGDCGLMIYSYDDEATMAIKLRWC